MRFPFQSAAPRTASRTPEPSALPQLKTVETGAEYAFARMGGDFYEFLAQGDSRLIFVLLDIAGKRESAMDIAAAVQDVFRVSAPQLFAGEHINDNEALAELTLQLNRGILAAAEGVCHSAAFVGCLNELVGTLSYCNAGHTPGLLKFRAAVDQLPANAPPLGLFSHATYEPQVTVLQPGAVLLLGSRGLLESKYRGEEYGVERLTQSFQAMPPAGAREVCRRILDGVEDFTGAPLLHNDVTAIAVVRK